MGQGCSETGESGRTRGVGAEVDRWACLVSRERMRAGAAERRRESGREAGRGKRFAGLSAEGCWAGKRNEDGGGPDAWDRVQGKGSWAGPPG